MILGSEIVSDGGTRDTHVLVLEDSGIIALDIEAALRDAGFHVTVAASVAEARAHMETHKFRCGLLDFRLGDGDCTEIALALDRDGCAVATVSGFAPEAIDPALARFPLFAKPVEAAHLAAWACDVIQAR
jgi:DNA-binding NtrC family response regulator